tara:strand:- start:29319 stop:29654 length:336 start_codon:yes stop_codon:yes gene_type:complete
MFLYYRHENNIIIEQCDKEYYDNNPDNALMTHEVGKLDGKLLAKGYYIVSPGHSNINLSESYWALNKLDKTDWKVARHRDQLASSGITSLTSEEYQALLINRQAWREKASD